MAHVFSHRLKPRSSVRIKNNYSGTFQRRYYNIHINQSLNEILHKIHKIIYGDARGNEGR